MTTYRRAQLDGGSYFFTVNLAERGSSLLTDHAARLGDAFRHVRAAHPFVMDAVVVMPDHLHCLWTLPETDHDFGTRWGLIKSHFSRGLAADEQCRKSLIKRGERGIRQRRFWEHLIRDERDWNAHVDFIHGNPVKHGFVQRAVDWPHSSIHRFVREGRVDADWAAPENILELKLD